MEDVHLQFCPKVLPLLGYLLGVNEAANVQDYVHEGLEDHHKFEVEAHHVNDAAAKEGVHALLGIKQQDLLFFPPRARSHNRVANQQHCSDKDKLDLDKRSSEVVLLGLLQVEQLDDYPDPPVESNRGVGLLFELPAQVNELL